MAAIASISGSGRGMLPIGSVGMFVMDLNLAAHSACRALSFTGLSRSNRLPSGGGRPARPRRSEGMVPEQWLSKDLVHSLDDRGTAAWTR